MRWLSVGVVLFLATGAFAQPAGEHTATIKYLLTLRQPDGGFINQRPDGKDHASSLRATSAAVRGIRALGGELPNKELTAKFVEACYDPATGAFADAPKGKADVMLTAVGLMAAKELLPKFNREPSIKYLLQHAKTFEERRLAVAGMEAAGTFPDDINAWFTELEKTRNPDGTYGKADSLPRDTGGTIAMVLRTGRKLSAEHLKAVTTILENGQRADGGFGKPGEASDLETCYRVMRAMYLLKIQPKNADALRQFLSMCANKDGGYAVQPGSPSAASPTYYAATILSWLKK